MSPRYVPLSIVPERDRFADLDARVATHNAEEGYLARVKRCSHSEPYAPGCIHSYFQDLLRLSDEEARKLQAVESPVLRGRDPGETPPLLLRDDTLERVRRRLSTVRELRDLGSSNFAEGLRPSLPGYLGTIWGQASRATGQLLEALGTRALEPGMVDTSSGVPVVSLPRLATGSAVAVQASQNSAVQETDPTSSAASSPVSTVAGQVDMSRQLFDLSQPGLDAVVADDLSRALAAQIDLEIVNGSAASGRTRGLLNWSGILSITGSVASAQAFLGSLWQAQSQLAYGSGFGAASAENYLTILHPRRAAWLASGAGGSGNQVQPLVPGQLVVSAGIPTNLGGGTNEDVALVVEKSQVILLARGPSFRIHEDVLSGTLTVRSSARASLAVLVKNAAAVAKVTGLTPPSGF